MLLSEQEERGPVVTLATLQGQLLTAAGSRIGIWQYRDGVLQQTGFHHAGFVITSISTLKNYLLVSDLYRGLQFLQWRDRVFTVLSQRGSASSSLASEFMVDEVQSNGVK